METSFLDVKSAMQNNCSFLKYSKRNLGLRIIRMHTKEKRMHTKEKLIHKSLFNCGDIQFLISEKKKQSDAGWIN